ARTLEIEYRMSGRDASLGDVGPPRDDDRNPPRFAEVARLRGGEARSLEERAELVEGVAAAAVAHHEEVEGEHRRERGPRARAVEDEVVDDDRSAGRERVADAAEERRERLLGMAVHDVRDPRDVVRPAERVTVEVARQEGRADL